MGKMQVLCEQGDVTVEWDPKDEESTKKAKDEFDRLKGEGYEFFEPVESKGKRVTRFNKKAGKLIAAPGVASAKDKASGSRPAAQRGGPVDLAA